MLISSGSRTDLVVSLAQHPDYQEIIADLYILKLIFIIESYSIFLPAEDNIS